MDAPDKSGSHALPPAALALVIVLLALPVVALMWVSSYARAEPRLFGFPFFFWYQFLWVFLAAACTSIAYQVVVRHERKRRQLRDRPSTHRGTTDHGTTDGGISDGGSTDEGGRR